MPESIDPKKIYRIQYLATLLGATQQDLAAEFQSGALQGRKIGGVWYCTGKSLLKYFHSVANPSDQEATAPPEAWPVQAPNLESQESSEPEAASSVVEKGSAQASVPPSASNKPSVSPAKAKIKSKKSKPPALENSDPDTSKRELADFVKQLRDQGRTYKEVAELLNAQGVSSLSGTPWTHRSVDSVLRWGRLNT